MAKILSAARAVLTAYRCAPILAAAVALGATGRLLAAGEGKTFSHPDRIRYDSQCITIDGRDMVIYSGAFHYFRCPKELWRDRFTKLKEAGFNTVESYIPWNMHEKEMPASLSDFSKIDLKDADDWISMAEEFGFYVIIRPGPYICAEWDHGGFPGWLINKRPAQTKEPMWYRSDDPEFMAWSKHWLDAVCPMVAKHQITHKKPGEPGVILFQLENEYNYATFSEPIKMAYVKSLAEAATADGIDVPLFTCWTHGIRGNTDPVLRNVFDSCNFYTGWGVDKTVGDVEKLRKEQVDAPLMTTELQGGWFTTGLGAPPIRPDADTYRADLGPTQINNLTLLEWAHGETLTNYYMAFGGTNFGDTAAENISTSYDYSAPIRECGGVGDKFLRVKALGQFIAEHGATLARAAAVDCDVRSGSPDVSVIERRAPDGSRYFFVRTSQHDEARNGTAHVKETKDGSEIIVPYQLEAFGSKVLYLAPGVTDSAKGEWLPKAAAGPERPTEIPSVVKITDVTSTNGSGRAEWRSAGDKSLNELGVYDSRFVYFQTTVTVTAQDLKTEAGLELIVNHPPGDAVAAVLNGQRLAAVKESGDGAFDAQPALHPGENTLTLLYENTGTANGGIDMEKRAGVSHVHLAPAMKGGAGIGSWHMKIVARNANADRLSEMGATVSEEGWTATNVEGRSANQLKAKQDAVFRTTVDVSDADLKDGRTALTFTRVDDKGVVFVNGQRIGDALDWNQTYTFDAAKQLHAGKNSVAVLVHNVDGGGGLGGVMLTQGVVAAVGTVGELSYAGVAPEEGGDASRPDRDGSAPQPLITTERLAFELADAKPGVWVPWLLRLHAAGNGFIYLNGHPLGRYWQAGKQNDFYLPECWLNMGAGKKNVVALVLREVDKPVAVESAEAMPYSVYAEKR